MADELLNTKQPWQIIHYKMQGNENFAMVNSIWPKQNHIYR
jgi:hypothetical protein